MVGGSTSSLISLLDSLDRNKYEIYMALYENKGELINEIPPDVKVLKELKKIDIIGIIKMFFDYKFWKAIYFKFFKKKIGVPMQLMAQCRLHFSRKISDSFDAVIGYLECWPSIYAASNMVDARVRIGWIHTDYLKAGFLPNLDALYFSNLNHIIAVSDNCKTILENSFPKYKEKISEVENIVSLSRIENMSKEDVDCLEHDFLNFVVICRMDIYVKGLDRLLNILKKLEIDGFKFNCNFIGADENGTFKRMLDECNFSNKIKYLGQKTNPYCILKNSDVCLQLSRFEGKPIVVDEALLLGVPVFATNYNSAAEQVENGVNGLIFDNDEDSIYMGMKDFLKKPELLDKFKENLMHYVCDRTVKTLDSFDKMIGIVRNDA